MNTDVIADLDRRISQVDASLVTLRQEIRVLNRHTAAFVKVQELIAFGERSVGELKAQRAKLGQASPLGTEPY